MKPSRWWHILSVIVFIIFEMLAPLLMVFFIFTMIRTGEEFFIPGKHDMKLEKTGKYTIWNVSSEFRDGKQYNFPATLPNGTRIRITDQSKNREIPTEASPNFTESSGTASRSSICDFEIDAPGNYSINVDGTSEQRLMMVRHSLQASLIKIFILVFSIAVFGILFPVIFSICIEVRRYRNKQAITPPAIPAE